LSSWRSRRPKTARAQVEKYAELYVPALAVDRISTIRSVCILLAAEIMMHSRIIESPHSPPATIIFLENNLAWESGLGAILDMVQDPVFTFCKTNHDSNDPSRRSRSRHFNPHRACAVG
jgi:hypothetical protein